MANEGVNRLARALDGRSKQLGNKPPILDYGVIQDDMSLMTNNFPCPIPQRDYVVCRSVAFGAVNDIFYKTQDTGKGNSGEHMHGPNGEHGGHTSGDGAHGHLAGGGEMKHVHDVLVGPKFRSLKAGDRVLVAWIGNDACVIDIILPASSIGG